MAAEAAAEAAAAAVAAREAAAAAAVAAERNLSALAPFTAGAEASELPPSVDGGFDADAVAGDEVTSVGTAVRDSTLVDSARVSRYDALREVRAAATGAVQDPIKNGVVPRRTVHLFERKFQGRRVSLRRVVLASKVCQRPGAHRTLSRVDSRYVVQVGPLRLCVSLHPGGGQRSFLCIQAVASAVPPPLTKAKSEPPSLLRLIRSISPGRRTSSSQPPTRPVRSSSEGGPQAPSPADFSYVLDSSSRRSCEVLARSLDHLQAFSTSASGQIMAADI